MNKQITNKEKKERGLSYATYKGNIIPARSVKSPCYCKTLKCDTKYDDNVRKALLENLLKLPMSGQEQFIANHIEVFHVKKTGLVNKFKNNQYCPDVSILSGGELQTQVHVQILPTRGRGENFGLP